MRIGRLCLPYTRAVVDDFAIEYEGKAILQANHLRVPEEECTFKVLDWEATQHTHMNLKWYCMLHTIEPRMDGDVEYG